MEGNNVVSSDILKLRELLDILENQQTAVRDVELLQSQFRAVLRDLESITKLERQNIDAASKKRRGELVSNHDKNIAKAEETLKKARAEREKNFEKCKRDRIVSETEELIEETKRFRSERKELLKQNRMPIVCRSAFFLALFAAKGIFERMLQVVMFLLVFVLLPYGIYMLIPFKHTLVLAGLYSAVIVLLMPLYVAISNRLRIYKWEIVKSIRKYNADIRANCKRIRKIRKSIKKDASDEPYDLQEFDLKIQEAEADYYKSLEDKENGIREFDTVIQKEIEEEVESKNRTEKEALLKLRDDIGEKLKTAEGRQRELAQRLAPYESVIGKEQLKKETIVELIGILEAGKAANTAGAVKYLNASKTVS